jgi:hypothetical protein
VEEHGESGRDLYDEVEDRVDREVRSQHAVKNELGNCDQGVISLSEDPCRSW